jgi:hypothetical protein
MLYVLKENSRMDIVLLLHSLVRFLILIAAIVGIVKALVSLARKSAPDSLDQTVASIFLGLYDLQVLSGILIILLGGLTQAIHPVVMFIGVVIAYGMQNMTQRAKGSNVPLYRLGFYVLPLLVILIGLAAL